MERTNQARVSQSANDLIIFIFLCIIFFNIIMNMIKAFKIFLYIEVINFNGCFF